MGYTFEKVHYDKDLWQVRYKGEFICYMKKLNVLTSEVYTNEDQTIWSNTREGFVDNVLLDMGYNDKEDFYNDHISKIYSFYQ